jgi:hypothetical protein
MPRKYTQIDFNKIANLPEASFGVDLSDVDEENLAIQDFEENDTMRLQREIEENLDHNGYIRVAQ